MRERELLHQLSALEHKKERQALLGKKEDGQKQAEIEAREREIEAQFKAMQATI